MSIQSTKQIAALTRDSFADEVERSFGDRETEARRKESLLTDALELLDKASLLIDRAASNEVLDPPSRGPRKRGE